MDASANTISGGVKNDIYGNRLFCNRNSSVILGVFIMKIGDRCFVHGYVDEIRKDVVIIKNKGGYFGTDPGEVITVTNTAHPNWIPCSERLPEHGGRYLISVLDGINRRTTVAPYLPRCKAWTMTGRMAYWKVIAWMPLPEPAKEDDYETD